MSEIKPKAAKTSPATYTMSDIIALWSIQESLLQSYRSMYLSMQTFFIATYLLISTLPDPSPRVDVAQWVTTILALGSLLSWLVTTQRREARVDFLQRELKAVEAGVELGHVFHYSKRPPDSWPPDLRERQGLTEIGNPAQRYTRMGFRQMPWLFLALWLVLIAIFGIGLVPPA